jgi:hypothetical protein
MNSAPVRHLLEGSSPFISGPAGIPVGSGLDCGGLPFAQGMTPRSSIHLPITALLSSGQVVQNFSDSDTSTILPLSSTTSTEPRVPLEVAAAITAFDPDAVPCAGAIVLDTTGPDTLTALLCRIYPGRHNRRVYCYNGSPPPVDGFSTALHHLLGPSGSLTASGVRSPFTPGGARAPSPSGKSSLENPPGFLELLPLAMLAPVVHRTPARPFHSRTSLA